MHVRWIRGREDERVHTSDTCETSDTANGVVEAELFDEESNHGWVYHASHTSTASDDACGKRFVVREPRSSD